MPQLLGQRCDDRAKHSAYWVEAGHTSGGRNPCATMAPSSYPVDIDACTEFGFTEFMQGGLHQLCIKPANAVPTAPFVARDVFMTVSDLRGSNRGFGIQALWCVCRPHRGARCPVSTRAHLVHVFQARYQGRGLHRVWTHVHRRRTLGSYRARCSAPRVCSPARATTFTPSVCGWWHQVRSTATRDADCVDESLQLLRAGTPAVATHTGNEATAQFGPFPQMTAEKGLGWQLCYAFGHDGVFRLYPHFRLDVLQPQVSSTVAHAADGSGTSTTGAAMRAVADRPTVFTFLGVGLSTDDGFKFVPAPTGSIVADDYCDGFAGIPDVTLATQLADGTVAASHENGTVIDNHSGGKKLVLCYRHGDASNQSPDGYTIYMDVVLEVTKLTSAPTSLSSDDLRLGLGELLPLVPGSATQAVVGVEKLLDFATSGAGMRPGDCVKWVVASATGCEASDADLAGGPYEERYLANGAPAPPACLPLDDRLRVRVTFRDSYTEPLKLCYRFADVPFQLYTELTMWVSGATAPPPSQRCRGLLVFAWRSHCWRDGLCSPQRGE